MNVSQFIGQKSYEKIIKTVRRHGTTFIPYITIFIFLALVPVGVGWLLNSVFPTLWQNPIGYPLLIISGSVYYLSLCLFFYSYFVAFYLDMWIITNDRIVDINQISLFGRTVAEVELYQIQDVAAEVHGFFPTIFRYGTLTLQTAGTVPKFVIEDVPRPYELQKLLLDLSNEDKKYHAGIAKK